MPFLYGTYDFDRLFLRTTHEAQSIATMPFSEDAAWRGNFGREVFSDLDSGITTNTPEQESRRRPRREAQYSLISSSLSFPRLKPDHFESHFYIPAASASTSLQNSIDEESGTLPGHTSIVARPADSFFTQVYMLFFLGLPFHYFSRFDWLHEAADMAFKNILAQAVRTNGNIQIEMFDSPTFGFRHSPHKRFIVQWRNFIDDLLREWGILNFVSALLVPGILTIFQIMGASNDPVTRYLAFWSLISALISLLYGCIFIIRFSRMRGFPIAVEWVSQAQSSRSSLWNVGVMLSLPASWLFWSITPFLACIMAFMWRSGINPPSQFSVPPHTELAFRVFISATLGVGVCHSMLILISFRRYGTKVDDIFSKRINDYGKSTSTRPPLTRKTELGAEASTSSNAVPKSVNFLQQSSIQQPLSDPLSDPPSQLPISEKSPMKNSQLKPHESPLAVSHSVSFEQDSSIASHPSPIPILTSVAQPEEPVSPPNVKNLEAT